MPKLGLGVDISSRPRGSLSGPTNVITLCDDNFISWPTNSAGFTTRQFFSSGPDVITWGSGYLQNVTSGSNRHLITYFDCLKEQYPVYYNGIAYGAGNQIVYGGIYGHGLFQKTGAGAGGGSGGWPPNFLFTPSQTQDANGWTRVRPTLRTIQAGKTLTISFGFRAVSPGTIGSNTFRFAVLNSTIGGTKLYVNADNFGLANTLYGGNGTLPGFRGYMAIFASTLYKILTRTDTSSNSLVNTLAGATTVWTENISRNLVNLSLDTDYNVVLKIYRPIDTPTSLIISSNISGGNVQNQNGVLSPTITYTDVAPSTFAFDTFVAYTTSSGCSGLKLTNFKATYG